MDLATFTALLQNSAVARVMNETAMAFPVVESLHVVAIAIVFGSIAIVDLRLLGYPHARRPFTEIAAETLKWTWAGFALAIVTGAMMFVVKPNFYIGNFEFRMKMLLLLLAGINMAIFEFYTTRSVGKWNVDRAVPLPGRIAGTLSLLFWIGVVTYGRLVGFAETQLDMFAMPPA